MTKIWHDDKIKFAEIYIEAVIENIPDFTICYQ